MREETDWGEKLEERGGREIEQRVWTQEWGQKDLTTPNHSLPKPTTDFIGLLLGYLLDYC